MSFPIKEKPMTTTVVNVILTPLTIIQNMGNVTSDIEFMIKYCKDPPSEELCQHVRRNNTGYESERDGFLLDVW